MTNSRRVTVQLQMPGRVPIVELDSGTGLGCLLRRPRSRNQLTIAGGPLQILIVALSLCLSSGCGRGKSPPPPSPVVELAPEETAANRRLQSGYVGLDACSDCHKVRVETFRETRHYLACVEASQVPMPAGFDAGRNRYTSIVPGLRFEMVRENDEFWLTAIRQSPEGEQKTRSRIDLVYGHGAGSDEAYFSWQGESVFELPMVWLHPQQCWAAAPINPYAGGDYSRPLTAQCLNCHSTWIDRRPGTPERFRRETALLGVTCERCHGPGREHVTHHQRHPLDRTAEAIVHPGKLSRERLLDLCAQCHDNGIRFKRPPFTYRPGDVLSDFIQIPTFEHVEDNHVANQHGGMRASLCFQNSDTLTCISCHDPHHARSSSNAGAASCAQCHPPERCRERPNLPPAIQNLCVNCHMPAVNKVQVNFRTEQDAYVPPVNRWEHRIAIYPEARDATLLEWLRTQSDDESDQEARRLAASLGLFWRNRAAAYREDFRFLMAIDALREAERVDSSDETQASIRELVALQTKLDQDWFEAAQLIQDGRHTEAIALLENILTVNPRFARAHGRLGTLYAAIGQMQKGKQHLHQAIELDPNDSYGHGMLGWLAYLNGEYQQALLHLDTANTLEPLNPKLMYQRGLVLAALGRAADAEASFREVTQVNPDDVDACVALVRICLEQRRSNDAVPWARRASAIAKEQNPELLLLLADCLLRSEQFNDARQSMEQALKLSKDVHPELTKRAQRQLDRLNERIRSQQ